MSRLRTPPQASLASFVRMTACQLSLRAESVQPCGAMKPLVIEPLVWIASAARNTGSLAPNRPLLAVWEDALLADLVTLESGRQESRVTVTEQGKVLLEPSGAERVT